MGDGTDPTSSAGDPASTPPHCPDGHSLRPADAECPFGDTPAFGDRIPLPTPTALPSLPGYEVLGELGRGGMGVVYKARHVKLDRIVALKMIVSGAMASPEERRRFLEEARMVARLRHPGIVQVFDVGEAHGRPFFAMEFVEGGNLAHRLNGASQPPGDSAAVVEQLALAMQHAHEKGVVHRDLKPANVLRTRDGQPKVTDFGLAKAYQSDDSRTESGAVVGTPGYMAPEQALGKSRTRPFGPAVDVYGLGAVLYECLTGRPPFLGETVLDALRQVLSSPPLPPSRLRPGLPRDLETICLKCLEKEPWRRYPTARELGDDLRRYLNHEPVRARPPGPAGRVARWCRRHPVVAALTAAVVAVFLLGFAGVTWKWLDADFQKDQKEWQRQQAEQARQDAVARKEAEKEANRKLEMTLHVANVNLAFREWQANSVGRADQILDGCAAEWRGWEWGFLKRLCHNELSGLDAGRPVVCLARDREGRVLAAGDAEGAVAVWTRAEGEKAWRRRPGPSFPSPGQGATSQVYVRGLAVSPDGQTAAACSWPKPAEPFGSGPGKAETRVWNLATGEEVFRTGSAHAVAFSPDGAVLAVASHDFGIDLWDVTGKRRKLHLAGPELLSDWYDCLSFSADGESLAAGNLQGRVELWDAKTGRHDTTFYPSVLSVYCIAFSADGQFLAAAGNGEKIDIWDLKSRTDRRPAHSLHVPGSPVRSLGFHPREPVLATATDDRVVKLWNLKNGRETMTLRGHTEPVSSLLFTPDGQRLVTAGGDGAIKVWNPHEQQDGWFKMGLTAAVSPANDLVATTGWIKPLPRVQGGTKSIYLFDARSGAPVRTLESPTQEVTGVAFGPGGRLLASAAAGDNEDGEIVLWRPATGEVHRRLSEARGAVRRVAFSPDGRLLAAAVERRRHLDLQPAEVVVRDPEGGEPLFRVMALGQKVTSLEFTPDGRLLLVAVNGGPVQLLDARTGREVRGVKGDFRAAALSADGSLLATAGGDRSAGGRVEVRLAETGEPLWELTGHGDAVLAVAFSPDRRRLVTGGADETVRVWDAKTRQELLSLTDPGPVNGVAFSPDGELIVSSGGDFVFRPGATRVRSARPVEREGVGNGGRP
jgi:WD40 repeat protein/tRNA A-37 threonylcarbamoyl transferase component Bud32